MLPKENRNKIKYSSNVIFQWLYEMHQQTVVQQKGCFVVNILCTFNTNAVWLNQNKMSGLSGNTDHAFNFQ